MFNLGDFRQKALDFILNKGKETLSFASQTPTTPATPVSPRPLIDAGKNLVSETQKTFNTFQNRPKTPVNLLKSVGGQAMNLLNVPGDIVGNIAKENLEANPLTRNTQIGLPKTNIRTDLPTLGFFIGSLAAPGPGGKSKAAREFAKFQGFSDLSTHTLNRLVGKDKVSRQFIQDLARMPELKQAERDLINETVRGFKDEVPVEEFANKVKAHLLPLKVNATDGVRMGTRYENVVLPDELRGPVANYSEHLYESPIRTSAGRVHFGDKQAPNYFAHTRIEDLEVPYLDSLPKSKNKFLSSAKVGDNLTYEGEYLIVLSKEGNEIKAIEVGKNPDIYPERIRTINFSDISKETVRRKNEIERGPTRRVLEIQSDLFQKGRLDNELRGIPADYPSSPVKPLTEGSRVEEMAKLKPYENTWHERIIKEEIKQAAVDGKTKLQFPTGKTAMMIEGLGEHNRWGLIPDEFGLSEPLTPQMLKVGREVATGEGGTEAWVITDVLGDGKFKAVPKNYREMLTDTIKNRYEAIGDPVPAGDELERIIKNNTENLIEEFDISGEVDTNNPIYRFYEKEVQRYLNRIAKPRRITDPQGVEWFEVDITPQEADKPITAFAGAPLLTQDDEEEGISLNTLFK